MTRFGAAGIVHNADKGSPGVLNNFIFSEWKSVSRSVPMVVLHRILVKVMGIF